MFQENWRPIPGYEGRYCVSDLGNVMSMSYMGTGLPGLLAFSKSRGYLSIDLQTGPIKKRFVVHRLVALAFIGPRPEGQHINHIDGVKTNNAASNLEYVTPSENQKHSFKIGLHSLKGERHTRAKLTNEAVHDIRMRIATGQSQKEVSKFYGVSESTIYKVARGLRWPHIPFAGEVRVIQ